MAATYKALARTILVQVICHLQAVVFREAYQTISLHETDLEQTKSTMLGHLKSFMIRHVGAV